jgi:Xaa-Pro aminopeptidase
VLFVRPRDKERETWTGRRAGIEGAMSDYGADHAYGTDEFQRVAARSLEKAERIYYPLGVNERSDVRMLEMVKNAAAMRPRLGSGPNALLDPREILHEARLHFTSIPKNWQR